MIGDVHAMPCGPCVEQLDAYLDGELDQAGRATVEDHLSECRSCRAEYERRQTLGAMLRGGLPTFRAPDLLRARVEGTLRTEVLRERSSTASTEPTPAGTSAMAALASARRWRWAAIAASALLVTTASYAILAARRGAVEAPRQVASVDPVMHDVLTSHVRGLMPGHLTDVVSSSQHTVKPWFNGRLDYSPPVNDLSDAGYPLVGGRTDYVAGRAVAVLIYQRRRHVISMFVWPAGRSPVDDVSGAALRTQQGYHALSWSHAGMTRWAISDLNPEELREFARLEQRADSLATGAAVPR